MVFICSTDNKLYFMEYLNNSIFSTKPSHCSFRFLPATREMCCYNAVIADARVPSASDIQALCSILSPELALPSGSHASTTRSHGALHILGTTTSFYFSFTLFAVQFTAQIRISKPVRNEVTRWQNFQRLLSVPH